MSSFPQSLKEHRSAYGFSNADLALLSRLSERRILELESGVSAPSLFEVASLARALAVEPKSLVGQVDVSDAKRSLARFRAPQGVREITGHDMRLLAKAAEVGRVCAHLLELVDGKPPVVEPFRRPIPVRGLPWKHGYELGAKAREQFIPGGQMIPSVQASLESLGIHVAFVEFQSSDIDAASVSEPGACPIVLLNTSNRRVQSPLSRRAILAHELCHVLHDAGERDLLTCISREKDSDPLEQRANAFAPSFLAPEQHVKVEGASAREIVANVAFRWGFTFKGAAWHAANLNLIDKDDARVLNSERRVAAFQPECERPVPRLDLDEFCSAEDVSALAHGLVSDLAARALMEGLITRGRALEIVTTA